LSTSLLRELKIQSASEKLRWKMVILYSRISLCGIGLAVMAVHIRCLLVKVSRLLECVKMCHKTCFNGKK